MAGELICRFLWNTTAHQEGVSVTWIEHRDSGFKAFAYRCKLEEDFDGAPRCYASRNPGDAFGQTVNAVSNPDTQLQRDIAIRPFRARPDYANPRAALDYLGNATSDPPKLFQPGADFAWVGLTAMQPSQTTKLPTLIPNADPRRPATLVQVNVPSLDMRPGLGARRKVIYDRNGNALNVPLGPNEESFFPVIQDAGMLAPGFFVSTTSVPRDTSFPETDPRRFFDATAVPYQAYNGWMGQQAGARPGDFGLALHPITGKISGFILADSGGGNKAGEVSAHLLSRLGGHEENDHLFLVFPRSGAGLDGVTSSVQGAPSFAASAELVKLGHDDDAAQDLIMFLAAGADLAKFNTWRNGGLSRDVMLDVQEAYINMRQILKDWGVGNADATLGVD